MQAAGLAKEGQKITNPAFPENSYVVWDKKDKCYDIWILSNESFPMNPDFIESSGWITQSGEKIEEFIEVLKYLSRGVGITDPKSGKIIKMDMSSNMFYKSGYHLFTRWMDLTPKMLISNEWAVYIGEKNERSGEDAKQTDL